MVLRLGFTAAFMALGAVAAVAASTAPSQEERLIPIPRQKPANLVPQLALPGWPAAGGGWPAGTVKVERASCARLLAGKSIAWSPLAPIGREGGCGAAAPVEVAAIDGVTLMPSATLTCAMAAALHDWITGAVQPAARKDLGTQVTVIHTASSYACRLRNNRASGKLSEHGRANALDMAGFSFARTKDVAVADGWGGFLRKIGFSRKGNFLEDIRGAACTHFTTVLGPGSDSYHGDHFHVDVLQRRNGWRVCK